MLRDGPIPRFIHGLIEYAAAVALFVAPFVLSFKSNAATAASVILGVVVLFVAASTDGSTSLSNTIPVSAHVALDYVLALVLIAMPFLAGFSGETAPTAFFITLGVLHLLITIGTRFRRDEPDSSRGRGRLGRGSRQADQAEPSSEIERERRA